MLIGHISLGVQPRQMPNRSRRRCPAKIRNRAPVNAPLQQAVHRQVGKQIDLGLAARVIQQRRQSPQGPFRDERGHDNRLFANGTGKILKGIVPGRQYWLHIAPSRLSRRPQQIKITAFLIMRRPALRRPPPQPNRLLSRRHRLARPRRHPRHSGRRRPNLPPPSPPPLLPAAPRPPSADATTPG